MMVFSQAPWPLGVLTTHQCVCCLEDWAAKNDLIGHHLHTQPADPCTASPWYCALSTTTTAILLLLGLIVSLGKGSKDCRKPDQPETSRIRVITSWCPEW